MLSFSYSEVEREKQLGTNGSSKTTTAYKYEDATVDDLTSKIEKLQAKGYDVTVAIKLKIPKG